MKDTLNAGRVAHDGFRKLPGCAVSEMGSSTYQHGTNEHKRVQLGNYEEHGAGNIKEIGEGAGAQASGDAEGKQSPDNSTAIGGTHKVPGPPLSVPADVAMSARHHKESIKFNLSHAHEHEKEAVKHKKALASLNRKRGK